MGRVNKTTQLKKAAIEALYKNKGNVSVACSAVGIGRKTFYDWKKDDKQFAEAVDNVGDFVVDHVESKLHAAIDNGEVAAIIFYLKTIGKRRGYIERQEIAQTDTKGNDVTPTVKLDLLSPETIKELIKAKGGK